MFVLLSSENKMDKSWMLEPRTSETYLKGCREFLDFAFLRAATGDEILCPCIHCSNGCWRERSAVYEHLVCKGFDPNYRIFRFHGEDTELAGEIDHSDSDESSDEIMYDNIEEGLLNDAFRGGENGPDDKTKQFYSLLEKSQEELYPGCKNFSKLTCIIRLYLLKCLHGWSDSSFDSLLTALLEMFPFAKIPKTFSEAKKMIRDLGLDYEKIDACPNDCILYWKENEDRDSCPKCKTPRWKDTTTGEQDDKEDVVDPKTAKIPQKVLRYFPLIPRLQRLFMSSKTAKSMRWHHEKRKQDGKLRHPADGKAWKEFDELHPEFSADPRNVRLALSSDGFNPFRTMNLAHSTWPVVLMCYNLPYWMGLKPEYFMLTMIIPGKSAPGNDIDVYMQPLIEELKTLWDDGVNTYDASTDMMFPMRAALMWTITDLPGLSVLSGHVSKGTFGCPICHTETCSLYLHNSKKMCYMGHRRFLGMDHKWRHDSVGFDGTVETRSAPVPLSGSDVLAEIDALVNDFGKTIKKKHIHGPWKKRSIFFELPYWEHNRLRHCLDVMHIEKNIFDSVVGTLLEMSSKSKDHLNARLDLRDLGIKQALHPRAGRKGLVTRLPKACYTLTAAEKTTFCSVLKSTKFPDGLASNISNYVNVNDKKLSGYKSHDAHVILHYVLQVAVGVTAQKDVSVAMIRLGAFF